MESRRHSRPRPLDHLRTEIAASSRWIFEDLYEQCSFHMAEKIPSSVTVGSRPDQLRIRSYSSGLSRAPTSSGVILGSFGIIRGRTFPLCRER